MYSQKYRKLLESNTTYNIKVNALVIIWDFMSLTIPKEIHKQISDYLWESDFSYTVDDQGMDNIVYIIEDEYILRLSRYPEHNFDKEIQVIEYLSHFTSIKLPIPLLKDKEGKWFFYKKISWDKTNISKEGLEKLSPSSYLTLITQLANFMSTMHSLANHRPIVKIWLHTYDKSYICNQSLKWTIPTIQEPEVKKRVEIVTQKYEAFYKKNTPIQFWLLHNDLYGNHFFTDIATWKIDGIIDFSDITISDIQLDFTFFYTPDTNLRSDLIDEYCKISKTIIDKDFVLLNCKIFITYHYLKYINSDNRFWRAKKRIDGRISAL